MVSIMILSNNKGKNTCTLIMNKDEVMDLVSVMRGNPELRVIDPGSDLAIDACGIALDRINSRK